MPLTRAKVRSLQIIKYILEKIDEIKELNPEGAEVFRTHLGKLTPHNLTKSEFDAVLAKISLETEISFSDEKEWGSSWGEYPVTITVTDIDKFEAYLVKINEQLESEKKSEQQIAKKVSAKETYVAEPKNRWYKNPLIVVPAVAVILAAIISASWWSEIIKYFVESRAGSQTQNTPSPIADPTLTKLPK